MLLFERFRNNNFREGDQLIMNLVIVFTYQIHTQFIDPSYSFLSLLKEDGDLAIRPGLHNTLKARNLQQALIVLNIKVAHGYINKSIIKITTSK